MAAYTSDVALPNHWGLWDEAVRDKHHLMVAEMCKVLDENGQSQGHVNKGGKLGRLAQIMDHGVGYGSIS